MADWWRYLVMAAGGVAIAAPVQFRLDHGSHADLHLTSSVAFAKPGDGGGGNGNSGNGNGGKGGESSKGGDNGKGNGGNGGPQGAPGGGNASGGNPGNGNAGSGASGQGKSGNNSGTGGGGPSNGGGSPSGGPGAGQGSQGSNGGRSGGAPGNRADAAPSKSGSGPGPSVNASSRAGKKAVEIADDLKLRKTGRGKKTDRAEVQETVQKSKTSAPGRSVASGRKSEASKKTGNDQTTKSGVAPHHENAKRDDGKTAAKASIRSVREPVDNVRAAPVSQPPAAPAAVTAKADEDLELIGSPTKPRQASNSIVVSGLSDRDLAALAASGLQVTSQTRGVIAQPIVRLSVPAGMSLVEAERVVRSVNGKVSADADTYYYTDGGEPGCGTPGCEASTLVGWTPVAAETCEAPPLIGLIDTGINLEHEALKGQSIELLNVSQEPAISSSLDHGTAIAALLVGRSGSVAPGLIPKAKLIAVDAFAKQAGMADRSDVISLVRAMEALAGRGVKLINLSLSGPPNQVLKAAIDTALAKGIVLVAAVGNNGAGAEPSYPAAYPGVIGVTAVDRQLDIYRRATHGSYVTFAAPGVEIRTAQSMGGSAVKSGTSYAVPFVSAAMAMMLTRNAETDVNALKEYLQDTTRDLGEPGRDPTFGYGLVQMSNLCSSPAPVPVGDIATVGSISGRPGQAP